MSNKKPIGTQTDTINRFMPYVQESLDLNRQDVFVQSLAVDFVHYKAMPSPIGQNDRGSYRRNDGVDTITSNGFIYRCAGTFSATITDNERAQKRSPGGMLDPSRARLILPRFYSDGKTRIYMAPGDRVYIADKDADTHVSNYEEMQFSFDSDNVPMFPICRLEEPIIDSRNQEYQPNVDFVITDDGNIRWVNGGRNPGIDPDTGKGRIYSIRYLYKAYWYIVSLPKEVRITNVTTNGVRSPQRMPYHAEIVREYIYHNQNKGDQSNQLKSKTPQRATVAQPNEVDPNKFSIPVEMSDITENDE
jgi:hypothetical protein